MKRPKNLDMDKINRIFNEHFEFAKEDLEKGLTVWTLTPKRDDNKVNEEEKCQTQNK